MYMYIAIDEQVSVLLVFVSPIRHFGFCKKYGKYAMVV